MIIIKSQTYPGMRNGYLCTGTATASTGVLTLTFTGKDISSKIVGLTFTPVNDSATTVACVQVTSIAFSAGVTTILARAFVSDDITTPAFTLTNSLVCHYSFWVNDDTLPADTTTNKPGSENI
jgi:hypothetical protein